MYKRQDVECQDQKICAPKPAVPLCVLVFLQNRDGLPLSLIHIFVIDVLMDKDTGASAADLPMVKQETKLQAIHGHIPLPIA